MQRCLLPFFLVIVAGSLCTAQHNDWQLTLEGGREWRDVRLQSLESGTLNFISSGNLQGATLGTIIEISRHDENSKHLRGFVAGAALGGSLGFVLGGIGHSKSTQTYSGGTEVTDNRVAYTIVGVLLGGVLGMAIGGSAGTVSYDLRDMKAEEKVSIIESIMRTETAEKPEAAPDSFSPAGSVPAAPVRPRPSFSAHAGLAIPTGDFADLNGGAAVTGFLIGGDLQIPFSKGAISLTSATLCINSVDEATLGSLRDTLRKYNLTYNISSWTSIWVVTGLRLMSPLSPAVTLYGTGQIGLLFGQSPTIEIRGSGAYGKVASASSQAFAYGIGTGLLIADRYDVGFRFLHSNPEYTITGGSTTATGNVSTSILQLTAGIKF